MKKILIIAGIILIALLIRLIGISRIPLYGDELTITQDAYSILHTGKDVTGKAFPLTFSMGAGRPGGYVYASIPFIALFGETAMGVRGLSVLSGLGIILLVYLLAKKLFSEKVGIIAAGLAAVSPWAINLSRGGFEANFALLLALGGTYLFLKGTEKPLNYIFSSLLFGLTIFTYPTFKLTLPFLLCLFLWYTGGVKKLFEKPKRLFVVIAICVGLIFVGVSLGQTFIGNSEERFSSINIFSSEDVSRQIIEKINFERSKITLPLVDRLFHNKAVEYFDLFKRNYLSNLSLNYLFLDGDGNPRHNMTQTGVLFVVELATILLGGYYLLKKNKREFILLVLWILIIPLATALIGNPHTLRNAFMFPALTIISSVGIFSILEGAKDRKRTIFFVLIAGLLIIQLIFLIERLYLVSSVIYEKAWSYPAQRTSEIAIGEKTNYDYIFLSDGIDAIEYAYPVYGKVSAQEVQSTNKNKVVIGGASLKQFGNVYIGKIDLSAAGKLINNLAGKILYIGSIGIDDKIPAGSEIIKFSDPTLNLVVVRKEF